jgi:hypothetical protein
MKYYYITTKNNITTVEVSKYQMSDRGDVIIEEYDNGDIYIASNKTKLADQYYIDKFSWYQLQANVYEYENPMPVRKILKQIFKG